jgi:Tol biopolymer transport system component
MILLFPWLRLTACACLVSALLYALVSGLVLAAGVVLPEDDQVAFMSNRALQWDIYLLDVRRGVIVMLTSNQHNHRYPRWSPDGTRLAYHARPARTASSPYHLYVMESVAFAQDSHRLHVPPETAHNYDQAMVTWSPDGQQIIFQERPARGGNFSLYLSDSHSRDPRLILEGKDGHLVHPAWSPDGNRLAFVLARQDIFVVYTLEIDENLTDPGVNTQRMQPVTTPPHQSLFPAWSPDGQRIAFLRIHNGVEDVFVMDADGGNVRNLTNSPTSNDWHPAWLPDGSGIIFSSDRDGNYNLYVMDADGGNVRRLTNGPGDKWAPNWRP